MTSFYLIGALEQVTSLESRKQSHWLKMEYCCDFQLQLYDLYGCFGRSPAW